MSDRINWFLCSLLCLISGHIDIVVFYNPFDGRRDLGKACSRCGRPKYTTWDIHKK